MPTAAPARPDDASAPIATLEVSDGSSRLDLPASGDRSGEPATLGIGLRDLLPGPFRRTPPGAAEIDTAIARIEDALMPLARRMPPVAWLRLHLPGSPEVARGLAEALGAEAGATIGIDEIERAFGTLAAIAEGAPPSRNPAVVAPRVAAVLLIVREAMHHLALPRLGLPPAADDAR